MERANEAAVPTVRLTSVEAAYWCQIRDRIHLRWVVPHDEDALLDALARLHAVGARRGRRGLALRRLVPGARPGRAGVGPAAGDQRRVAGGARSTPSRCGWARRMADSTPLDEARPPGPGGAAQPPADAALTDRTA